MSEQPIRKEKSEINKHPYISEFARPDRIRMGRLLRAMTQREVAAQTGIDQGLISKYENGRRVTDDDLAKIARVLQLPLSFFYRPVVLHAFNGASTVMFRRGQSVPERMKEQLLVEMNRIAEHMQDMFESVEIQSTNTVPIYQPKDGSMEEIEDIAERTRLQLRIPPGPIQSMTRIMESMKVIIVHRSLPLNVDALVSTYGSISILLLNAALLGGRQRLTLAHELGHLVMHSAIYYSYEELEKQAFRFGSAFMAPAQELKSNLRNKLTMERLIALSAKWGMSVQALVRRISDLDLMTERQYQYWNQQLSKNGYRTTEPVTIPVETPRLLNALISMHLKDLRYTVEELASALMMEEWEVREVYLGQQQLRVVQKMEKPILKLNLED